MSYNPFRAHSKKEQERQKLMGLKKASLAALNFKITMQDMDRAMKELAQTVSHLSKVEMLTAVLRTWPLPMEMADPDGHSSKPVYIDTETYEFQTQTLLEIWGHYPIANFIELQFNECEEKDVRALFGLMAQNPPEAVMTIGMFMKLATEYFDFTYPIPKPEMFHSFDAHTMEQKDYFLPALKVLNWNSDGTLWSPIYSVPWTDNQLNAAHVNRSFSYTPDRSHRDMDEAMGHCECGIYASVNLSELWQYVSLPDNKASSLGMDYRFRQEDRRLCIIEPFSNATVWMARKGWKASKAFVSEIIGETISLDDAASLLSMVWRRRLDLRTLYEPAAP